MPSEFELLDWIAQQPQEFPKTVRCGIGDDCALLETEGTLAVTTDSLVEGVHFRRQWMSPWLLGRKALRTSLSDLAAMGARPLACVLALSLPPELGERYLKSVVRGLLADAARWKVALLGGDLTRCDLIHVNVTAWGRPAARRAVCRSTARAGDRVLVIGRLGRARLGLQLLESNPPEGVTKWRGRNDFYQQEDPFKRSCLLAQLLPRPLLEVGAWLAEQALATSLIDVSDGLAADLERLARQSGLRAVLERQRLKSVPATCPRLSWEIMMNGGEDYALLLTASRQQMRQIQATYPAGFPTCTVIGRMIEGLPSLAVETAAGLEDFQPRGFDHFR